MHPWVAPRVPEVEGMKGRSVTDWRTGMVAMTLASAPFTLAACKADIEAHEVPIPKLLQQPAELPFGDRQLAEITRGTTAALDLLEPRWGKLGARPYVVDAQATGALREQMRSGMPEGWQPIEVALPPERGELIAYSSGKAVFAVLIAPVRGAPVLPVTVLSNQD